MCRDSIYKAQYIGAYIQRHYIWSIHIVPYIGAYLQGSIYRALYKYRSPIDIYIYIEPYPGLHKQGPIYIHIYIRFQQIPKGSKGYPCLRYMDPSLYYKDITIISISVLSQSPYHIDIHIIRISLLIGIQLLYGYPYCNDIITVVISLSWESVLS